MVKARSCHASGALRPPLGCLAGSMVLTVVLQALALSTTEANALVESIVGQLGRSKGFCSVPNCGTGELPLAFLQRSGMKVHAMAAGAADVAAIAQRVANAGMFAPNVFVDRGTLSHMPYADRFVDCIVVTNLTDATLAGVSYAEVERVLCPGGMAWVGRAAAEGAGITQAALQGWMNAATKKRSTAAISTTNGTWVVVTGREVSGTDVWTRHNYDVTGVKYSKDSVAAFPWLPQAKLKPYRHPGSGGTVVTSGGRVYYIEIEPTVADAQQPWLRVYSIYNGELLWSRNVNNDGLGSIRSDPMMASPKYLYLHQSNALLQLDGQTGTVIRTQNFGLSSLSWFATSQTTGLVYGSDGTTLVACNEETGARAWTANGGDLNMYKDRILCGGTVLNAATGQPDGLGGLNIPAMPTQGRIAGCPPMSASINATYGSTAVYGWDFLDNVQRAGHFYKPPCRNIGTVVSNGFLIHAGPTCYCGSSRFNGFHIDASARSFQLDRNAAPDGSDRLEQGPAYNDATAQVVPDNLDWPTHRSTGRR
jgi:hypothetical protein